MKGLKNGFYGWAGEDRRRCLGMQYNKAGLKTALKKQCGSWGTNIWVISVWVYYMRKNFMDKGIPN